MALRNGTEVSVDDKVVANTVTVVADADERSELDNCSLLHLSEATLLHNTQLRFQRDEIYTLTGQIVTSLNPCKQLPALYDAAAMAATRAELNPGAGEMKLAPTPHIFTVAEAAYFLMVEQKRNQSIVVSGVSGAGKTEANKYVMRHLCSAEVRRQLKERLASRRAAAHLDGVEVSAPPPTVEPERLLRKVAYKPPPQSALPLDVLTLVARKDAHLATLIAAEGRRGGDGDHESVVTFT